MGRAPCCDKANVKKGPWSPEEDTKLKSYIEKLGTGGNWIALPQKIGLKRCGKSCRLRWLNYLRPNIKHGGFSEEEDNLICSLYISIGSRWSIIAAQLPGRTDNDIKNYWNTRLKKKLLGKQRKEHHASRRELMMRKGGDNSSASHVADYNHTQQQHHNQVPYWPELPILAPNIPYSNQEPHLNDHASIRKLLIKLGGRFSGDDDHNQQQIPNVVNCSYPIANHQIYDQSSDNISCAPVTIETTLNNNLNSHEFSSSGMYNMEEETRLVQEMLQGQNNVSAIHHDQDDHQIVYSTNNGEEIIVDGLEFLYGDEMLINYSQLVASSNNLHQEMVQECSYDHELRFHGGQ